MDDICYIKELIDLVSVRKATQEELKVVNQYIKSISKPTGVNFFKINNHKGGN